MNLAQNICGGGVGTAATVQHFKCTYRMGLGV